MVQDPGIKSLRVNARRASGLIEKIDHETIFLRIGACHRFCLNLNLDKTSIKQQAAESATNRALD